MADQINARLDFNLPLREKTAMARLARKMDISIGQLLRWSFEHVMDDLVAQQAGIRDDIVDEMGEAGNSGFTDLAWERLGYQISHQVDPEQ